MARKLSEDLNNPYLFSEHKAGEYEYGENSVGGKTATGSLQIAKEPVRDSKSQTSAGGDSRRSNGHEWGADDGGHMIGARFGGETGEENLTAQNRNLNRSDYKQMENEWAAHLEAGDKVFVHIETDDQQRPNAYMGYAIYESPDGSRDYDTFHMVNESRSEIAHWEEDAAEFETSEEYAQFQDSAQNVKQGNAQPYTGTEVEKESATVTGENGYLGEASGETIAFETAYGNESSMDKDSTMDND